MRTLLFTGKGGVGKTTVAAATALRCAEDGFRTLVVSTDAAHSLADVVGRPIADGPQPLAPGLWGEQFDAREQMESSWSEVQDWLREVFAWAGVDAVQAEELSVLPGMDEAFALADLADRAASGRWDVLVVDCAPTAETVRLLSLPDIASWYMARLFPVSRRVNRVVGPVVSRLSSLPTAGDEVFGAAHRFYERLEAAKALLGDPEAASIRLVVTPERVVVAEARRTHTYLSLFGYHTDAVVANRLLPEEVTDPWFATWRRSQAEQLEAIDQAFAPLPVLAAPLRRSEPVGLDALREVAEAVYPSSGPAPVRPNDVLHRGPAMEVVAAGEDLELVVPLPSAERGDLDLARSGDELLIAVGPYRRSVALPDSLRRRTVSAATLTDGRLRVCFGRSAPTTGPESG